MQRARVSSVYPSTEASPDREVSCKCHVDSLYEAKCPRKHRNKTMKKNVAKADSFLLTDKSFFANISKDILNRAFQFVGLRHISAGKVEEVSSTKPFQLKCSHQYHTQMHHAIFVSKKILSLSCFSSQREFLYVSAKEIILTGYFNINVPIEESSRKHLLTKGLKCTHFDQLVTDVTRLVSGFCLDHVYANRSKNTVNVLVQNYALSNHLQTFCGAEIL